MYHHKIRTVNYGSKLKYLPNLCLKLIKESQLIMFMDNLFHQREGFSSKSSGILIVRDFGKIAKHFVIIHKLNFKQQTSRDSQDRSWSIEISHCMLGRKHCRHIWLLFFEPFQHCQWGIDARVTTWCNVLFASIFWWMWLSHLRLNWIVMSSLKHSNSSYGFQ